MAKATGEQRARGHQSDPLIADIVGELPKLCTRAEAAAVLRRNPRTIDRWVARGLLRALRPANGFPLIPRSEIERLLRDSV